MHSLTPLTAAFAEDPYPYYARLVAERPFYFDAEIGMWVASSASVVDAVLHDSALRVRPIAEPVPARMTGTTLGSVFSRLARMTDGTFHAARRAEIVAWIEEHTRDVYSAAFEAASELAGDLPRGDAAALNTYVFDAPAAAMARIVGIGHNDSTREWIRDFATAIRRSTDAEAVARGNTAAQHLLALMGAPESTLTANVLGLFFQNYDATAAMVASALAEPTDHAIPVHNTRRFAATDTSILNHTVRKGDTVLVVIAAAHRDPSRTRSYAFGAGPHACPGERVARTIAQAAVDALPDRLIRAGGFPVAAYLPLPNVRIAVFGAADAALRP